MKVKPNFYIIKSKSDPKMMKKVINPNEKQDDWSQTTTGQYVTQPIAFSSLWSAYDNSFIISGICDKISTSCDSGFEKLSETKDHNLEMFVSKLDIHTMFLNLVVFGNSFNEVIRNQLWNGPVVEVDPILTETMNVKAGWGYLQIGAKKQVSFLEEEVIHIKRVSIRSKYYGDSIFSKCVQQVALLANIDKFYDKLFDNGLIQPNLLFDESGEMEQVHKDALKAMIQDNIKWLDNAFSTLIVPGKLSRIELSTPLDTQYFLEYRDKLIQSIAISTNIPYWLLINTSANRSTSDTEYNTFTKEIITPLQTLFLRQLKESLRSMKQFDDKAIDELGFNAVDTKNQKVEMETTKWYKDGGIITVNEARKRAWYEAIEWMDILQPQSGGANVQAALDQVTKSVKKIYSK